MGHFYKDQDHQQNERKLSPLHILVKSISNYYLSGINDIVNKNNKKKAMNGNQDGLDVLLRSGFDLELKDSRGKTALDVACAQGELGCVRTLVRAGAQCESRDYADERTPVHTAAAANNLDCLKEMLAVHYDAREWLANLRDRRLATPLMCAAEQGHLSTVSFLISHMGADSLLSDDKQRTTLHRAVCVNKYRRCKYSN